MLRHFLMNGDCLPRQAQDKRRNHQHQRRVFFLFHSNPKTAMILQLKVQRTSLSHADLVYSEMTPEEKVRNETKRNGPFLFFNPCT
eukprot:COSAG06_NODE_2272_length_7196_cov_4.916314_5_plen_86_part_00